MAKYCSKCMTFVPEGGVCPRCGNNELTDVRKMPKKAKKIKKVQNSLVDGKKTKRSPIVWVLLGVCVVLAVILAIVLVWVNRNNDVAENATKADESTTEELCDEVPYAEGLEYTLLDDGTYEVSGIGSFTGTELKIPPTYKNQHVTKIGDNAFIDYDRLSKCEIPNSVTTIGDYAFRDCNVLIEIKIPDSVTAIGDHAFWNCGMLSLKIPASVKFLGSGIATLSEVEYIEVDAENPNYTSIDGVIYTKDKTEIVAYPNCKAGRDYTVSDGVTKIGEMAFGAAHNLERIELSNGVTVIGDYAFWLCDNLKQLQIPNSVTNIGYAAFYDCYNLTDIYYDGTADEWANVHKEDSFIEYIESSLTVHFAE